MGDNVWLNDREANYMATLVVEHLKYRYPLTKFLALDDLSFKIHPGEFIGIIGENNAGKTTLCEAIIGLVPHFYKGAYGGHIWIDTTEVAKSDVSEICQRVGIVFQNPLNQITGAKDTVYEEIAFGLENLGLSQKEMQERIEAALELLGITAYRNRQPFDLSGGQMQRMAIASVIAMRPEVLILDEPTSQLDPEGSDEVFEAVLALAKQGITIIMVEHKMEKIALYSDRVMLLHQGKIIDFDTPQKVFSRSDLNQYGVSAPVFTQVAKALNQTMPGTQLYPVSLKEALQCIALTERGGKTEWQK